MFSRNAKDIRDITAPRDRGVDRESFMSLTSPSRANSPILEMGFSGRFGSNCLFIEKMPQNMAITRMQSTKNFALSGVIIHEAGPSQDQ